jgi:hypothetical protein
MQKTQIGDEAVGKWQQIGVVSVVVSDSQADPWRSFGTWDGLKNTQPKGLATGSDLPDSAELCT